MTRRFMVLKSWIALPWYNTVSLQLWQKTVNRQLFVLDLILSYLPYFDSFCCPSDLKLTRCKPRFFKSVISITSQPWAIKPYRQYLSLTSTTSSLWIGMTLVTFWASRWKQPSITYYYRATSPSTSWTRRKTQLSLATVPAILRYDKFVGGTKFIVLCTSRFKISSFSRWLAHSTQGFLNFICCTTCQNRTWWKYCLR